jgi:dephospho-CoA kinase
MVGAKLVVVDVPLLFESELDKFVNTTVVVYW